MKVVFFIKKIIKYFAYKIFNYSNPRAARQYIAQDLGVEGFFLALKKESINYTILRWFEDMPNIEPGEDIDILVADENVDCILKYLKGTKKGGVPCDIYTVSGERGNNWHGMSYYPIGKARQMLNNAVLFKGLYKVLGTEDYFYSLCYHGLYHKGYKSGINTVKSGKETLYQVESDHNYYEYITKLAKLANLPIPKNTLEDIDKTLGNKNWRPQRDTLEKLSKYNPWIKDHFFSNPADYDIPEYLRGLGVFLVRELGEKYLEDIREYIFTSGFAILDSIQLSNEERKKISENIRGGNWSCGPFSKSGGLPLELIIVYDEVPLKPGLGLLEQHIGLTNKRILSTKHQIRNLINSNLPSKEQFNGIHSSDNATQALDYIRECGFGMNIEKIKLQCKKYYTQFKVPYVQIEVQDSFSSRAKVFTTNYKGELVICKLFKHNRERFLQREVLARKIGGGLPSMSRIIEIGCNYLLIEYYDDYKNKQGLFSNWHAGNVYFKNRLNVKPLPIRLLKEIKEIVKFFRSNGYEYIDFGPHNILLDINGEIKIIDFEFLQEACNIDSKYYDQDKFLFDVPSSFKGDRPLGKYNGTLANWKKGFYLPGWALKGDYNTVLLVFLQYFLFTLRFVKISLRKILEYGYYKLRA